MTKHVPPPRSQAIAMLIRRRVRGFLRAALLRPLEIASGLAPWVRSDSANHSEFALGDISFTPRRSFC